jgi:hypothetical protein
MAIKAQEENRLPDRHRVRWAIWAPLAVVLCAAVGVGVYFLVAGGDEPQTPAVAAGRSPSASASPSPVASPTANTLRSVVVVTPANGKKLPVGEQVRITVRVIPAASAAEVRVTVNGRAIESPLMHRPYAVDWTPPTEANYSIAAEAFSATGETVRSTAVEVTAVRPEEPAPQPVQPADGTMRGWGAFFFASEVYDLAAAEAASVESLGFPVAVLNTIDYANLGKPGQEIWVVCAGPYDTRWEAEVAAEDLRAAGMAGAYAKEIY